MSSEAPTAKPDPDNSPAAPAPHWNQNSPLALEARSRMEARSYINDDMLLATIPGINFDPSKPSLTEDDLKPQPIIRKRKKVLATQPI